MPATKIRPEYDAIKNKTLVEKVATSLEVLRRAVAMKAPDLPLIVNFSGGVEAEINKPCVRGGLWLRDLVEKAQRQLPTD